MILIGQPIRSKKNEMKLARHLIGLRVHLSTAQLGWIDSFVVDANGLDGLDDLLTSFVGKSGKRCKSCFL